jgi:Flp pilus assembly pilin Flp
MRAGEVTGMFAGRARSSSADAGATTTEYCLLATFVALTIVGMVTLLGAQVVALLSAVLPTL